MIQRIDTFLGQYRFLSNFSPSEIRDTDGFVYRTAEHAYQAGKTEYVGKRAVIAAALTPGHAKRLGLQLDLRADWSEKRHLVMLGVLRAKFTDPWLMSQLCGTDPAELVEGNNSAGSVLGGLWVWSKLVSGSRSELVGSASDDGAG